MKGIRAALQSLRGRLTNSPSQQRTSYTDFQKEFGLDQMMQRTSRQQVRKEASREVGYAIPVGFVLVAAIAALLYEDEVGIKDKLLQCQVLKWKIATKISSVQSCRKHLLNAYHRYYKETPRETPKIMLLGIVELISASGNLSEQDQRKVEDIMQRILPTVLTSPSEATLAVAEKLLVRKAIEPESKRQNYQTKLALMCLQHGNLQQQYLALLNEPTLPINSKTIDKFDKNSIELQGLEGSTSGILAFKHQLKLQQALYILNHLIANVPTARIKLTSKARETLIKAVATNPQQQIFTDAIS